MKSSMRGKRDHLFPNSVDKTVAIKYQTKEVKSVMLKTFDRQRTSAHRLMCTCVFTKSFIPGGDSSLIASIEI